MKLEELINIKKDKMSVEDYFFNLTTVSMNYPSLVSNPWDDMVGL